MRGDDDQIVPYKDAALLSAKLLKRGTLKNPMLIADRYVRSLDGAKRLVELAEVLQCPIIDTPAG